MNPSQVEGHDLGLGVDPLEGVVLVALVLLIAKAHEDGEVFHLETEMSEAAKLTGESVKKY